MPTEYDRRNPIGGVSAAAVLGLASVSLPACDDLRRREPHRIAPFEPEARQTFIEEHKKKFVDDHLPRDLAALTTFTLTTKEKFYNSGQVDTYEWFYAGIQGRVGVGPPASVTSLTKGGQRFEFQEFPGFVFDGPAMNEYLTRRFLENGGEIVIEHDEFHRHKTPSKVILLGGISLKGQ
mgnify:CR=1 FL=1